MRRLLRVLLPLAVLLAGGLAAWMLIASGPEPQPAAPRAQGPLVRTVTVEPRTVRLRVESQGTVQPATQTALVAEVAGEIVSTALEPGRFFDKGEVLARIDPREYRLAVVQAKAELARARVALKRAEEEAEVARREWKELGRGDPTPLALHIPQLEEARAAVAAAEAALAKAELDLARTEVRAPYAGRVREKRADVGQFVNRGTPIADVYSTDYAEVTLPIPDEEAAFLDLPLGRARMEQGPPVILRASFAGREYQWRGRIVRTAGEIDPQTRTINAVARVDDPYAAQDDRAPLAVGLFVRAEILGRTLPDAYVLPRAALQGRDTVYVVDSEGRLQFREVEVVRRDAERVVIGAGLAPGARVVVSSLEAPVEGMRVRTAQAPPETRRGGGE